MIKKICPHCDTEVTHIDGKLYRCDRCKTDLHELELVYE